MMTMTTRRRVRPRPCRRASNSNFAAAAMSPAARWRFREVEREVRGHEAVYAGGNCRAKRHDDHLFGLTISEGGLMNMLRRAQRAFVARRDDAVAVLRRADVVASDETGVHIEVRIPIHSGHLFRFEAGRHSELKPATVPI